MLSLHRFPSILSFSHPSSASPSPVDALSLIVSSRAQDSDELAKIGGKCWILIIQTVGHHFDDDEWSTFLESFQSLLVDTLPQEICSDATRQKVAAPSDRRLSVDPSSASSASSASSPPPPPPPSLPFQLRPVVTKCTVQHLLLDAVADTFRIHFQRLSAAHFASLLAPLGASIEFARRFNGDVELRRRLWAAGFREHQRSVPDLFFQESHGMAVQAAVLLRMFKEGAHPHFDAVAVAEPKLLPLVASCFADFVAKDRANRAAAESQSSQPQQPLPRPHDDELRCIDPVVVLLLRGILEWSDAQFDHHIHALFAPLMELIEVESPAVRKALRELLQTRLPRGLAL